MSRATLRPVVHAGATGLLPDPPPGAGSATPEIDTGALTRRERRGAAAGRDRGVVGTTGSTALLADQLRAEFGVDGTGVKVGVLSDSFNVLGGAATDEADGDLPVSGATVLAEGRPGDTDRRPRHTRAGA